MAQQGYKERPHITCLYLKNSDAKTETSALELAAGLWEKFQTKGKSEKTGLLALPFQKKAKMTLPLMKDGWGKLRRFTDLVSF